MSNTTVTLLLLAAVGAAVGAAAAFFTSRRSVRQPDPFDVDAEAAVIAAVLCDPSVFFKVSVLEASAFVYGPHRQLWAAIEACSADSDDDTERALAAAAGLPARTVTLSRTALLDRVRAAVDTDASQEIDTLMGRTVDEESLLKAGGKVLSLADDRELYAGGLPLVDNPDGGRTKPVVRALRRPSVARVIAMAVCGAAGFAAGAHVAQDGWTVAAVLVAVAGLLVVSAVDIDTMYIDYPVLVPTIVTSWSLAAVAAFVAGDPGRLLAPLAIVVGVVGSMELLAFLYRKIRKREGLGGGDTALLLVSVGTPALAGAGYSVAVSGIVVAAALAIVAIGVAAVAGRRAARDPFAFGPFLAAGWLVAWLLA